VKGQGKCHPGLTEEVARLLQVAQDNPWWEFEAAEIGGMMNLPANTVAMLIRTKESPFVASRSRPERVAEFFRAHPGWRPSDEK
jgi:hypothetical protein